jgi:hypothetical protein
MKTFVCDECKRVLMGRTYGRVKYNAQLCARCFRDRCEADHPAKRARLLDTMRYWWLRRNNRTQPAPRQSLTYVPGSWHDPDVIAHHADMLRQYFGERTDE